jgi:hypothetical protein
MRNLKTISFSLLALLIASVIYPHAASAVTANSRCSKSGATATIKGQSYVCAQNPTVKTKRLTWTLKDCLAANTAYLTSLKSFNETEASSQKVLETIDASIKGLEAQVPIDKERAAKEQESATQNRTMAATRQKEADERYAKAKAAGVTAVTPAWAIQANAASNDGKITATELTNLAKTWAITPEQAAQVFNFLAAEKIPIRRLLNAMRRMQQNS